MISLSSWMVLGSIVAGLSIDIVTWFKYALSEDSKKR
jgi:hypothetical protein